MKKQSILYLLITTLVFAGCSDSGNDPDPLTNATVYVTNEGNFSDANGSITSYDPETKNTLKLAFENANNDRPLAGIIQSSHIDENRLFIVLNDADKVEVVNKETLESLGTIELSAPPTAVEIVGDQAYVTTYDYQTENDQVFIVDLSTMEVTDNSIEVPSQPRDIVSVGDRLYVSVNGGNTIEVIDPETNTVENTIAVGAAPTQMLVDNEERIWVVCNGRVSYDDSVEDVPGSIYVLNGQTGQIINSIESETITATGYNYRLALNPDQAEAYFLNNGISVIDMNNLTLSDSKFTTRSFNAIGYSSLQDRLYAGQSNEYEQDGKALLYNLEGTAVDSFTTGIAPNGFQFIQE